jgi:hypothetical protein
VTAAQVQAWQAATGANMMALMHCLFLRLRACKASQDRAAGGGEAGRQRLVYLPAHDVAAMVATWLPGAGNAGAALSGGEACVNRSDGGGGRGLPAGLAGALASGAAFEGGDDVDGFGLGDSSQDAQTWSTLWMLYVKALCRMAHDERYCLVAAPARHLLERALLSADVPVPYAHAWRDCYNQIVFPIVSAKFKSAGAASAGSAPSPAEALCLSTLLLLCKSFRNNLDAIIHLPELHMMWLRLLGLIEALKHRIVAKQRDAVSNDIVLVLKEMLHSMHSDKTFKEVQQASGQDMWALTSTVIDAFCPDLKTELMTGSPARQAPPPTAAHSAALATADVASTVPTDAGEAAGDGAAAGDGDSAAVAPAAGGGGADQACTAGAVAVVVAAEMAASTGDGGEHGSDVAGHVGDALVGS